METIAHKETPKLINNQQIIDAIEKRKSIRNFETTPLSDEIIEAIQQYLQNEELMRGAFGHHFRTALLTETALKDRQDVGTYGMVKNAQAYLVGISTSDPLVLFELAYAFHGLILYLTHLGLGTVWMGGSFNMADVKKSVYVGSNEIVPAIAAVGYPKGSRHMKERLVNLALRTKARKPMDKVYFFGEFNRPLGNDAPEYFSALDRARLAPSAKNRQSWRLVISEDLQKIHYYIQFSLKDEVGEGPRHYACPPEYLDIGTHFRSLEAGLIENGIYGHLEVHDPKLYTPKGENFEYICTWNKH